MRSFRLNVGTTIPRGAHLDAIDELKGFGIILILLYHTGGVLRWPNYIHGEIGVDIFLLVSGFMLALSAADQPLGHYFTRRFLRIYPAYWIALTLFLVTHRIYFGSRYSLGDVIAHYIGVHAYGGLAWFADVSDAFWFISMIVSAYLVFALLRHRLDDLSLLAASCGALTTVAAVTYAHFGHIGGLISLAARIPSFFVGLVAGRLLGGGTAEVRLNFNLGLGLTCFYYLMFFRNFACNYTLPAMGLFLTWIALRRPLSRVAVGRYALRAVAVLGLFSYEVYLFHQPLIRDYNSLFWARVMKTVAPSTRQLALGVMVALAVTGVIAVGVHYATEFAFRRFAPKMSAARLSGVTAGPPLPSTTC